MGLCKCPKRKVTNLFCFEHRVNVCEHCLVENHSRCVVQSYLNWLKDSDYNPDCQLCNNPLSNGNVVRLLCYDVFHEACLDRHYRKLPPNTAPAGYKCRSCNMGLFPANNQGGKVVEQLKSCLLKFNWARLGLGMPLIDESEMFEEPEIEYHDDSIIVNDGRKDVEPLHGIPKPDFNMSGSSDTPWMNMKNSSYSDYEAQSKKSDTVIMMENYSEPAPVKNQDDYRAISRKLIGANAADLPDSLKQTVAGNDPDSEDKYKRRPAWTWLTRWLRSRMLRGRGRGYHDMNVIPKRAAILLLVGIIAFFTIIIFATQVGRKRAEDNPFLDPMANPNIRIAHHVDAAGEKLNDDIDDENLDMNNIIGRRERL